MKITNQNYSHPTFKSNNLGKITFVEYHKFNHEFMELLCENCLHKDADFAETFGQMVGKKAEEVKKVFEEPIKMTNDFFKEAKRQLSKESLRESFTSILSLFRKAIVNEQSEITKLPPKLIIVDNGDEVLPTIKADVIIDRRKNKDKTMGQLVYESIRYCQNKSDEVKRLTQFEPYINN